MNNPYIAFIAEYARLTRIGTHLPLGGLPPLSLPPVAAGAPKVVVCSPHPDDECIVGALPLRLRRELGSTVVNVAITLGSKKERQPGRLAELQAACQFLGFDLVCTTPSGLERINPKTRQADPAHWEKAVQVMSKILTEQRPDVLFLPHADDWNSTHMGTHALVVDALRAQSPARPLWVVETEFWGAMTTPNLMVESTVEDVASLVAATTFHVEEVRRNPYHLSLVSWMQDNVRRGGEVVGGQGGAAPDFVFATLYRLQRYAQGEFKRTYTGGKLVSTRDSLAALFAP